MVEFDAIYAIWLREIKVYLREKERVIASVISPLLWLFVFGIGIGSTIAQPGINYELFVFPGILTMTILFTAVFYGMYIVWDRKLDFLKEVLVAPASRSSIFLGKALGGVTDAMIQALILTTIGAIFIFHATALSLLYLIPVLILVAFAMASLGLVMGSNLSSQEGFGLVSNFVMWPMFFFSGALYPMTNLPDYIRVVSLIDPVTYAVDAIRTIVTNAPGSFPLPYDLLIVSAFAIIAAILGLISFGNLQQSK